MAQVYYDRNGKRIQAGMELRNRVTGVIEKVHLCEKDDLGFSATNPAYLRNHPETAEESFFSLANFANGWGNLLEYEVVDTTKGKPWGRLEYPAVHIDLERKRREIHEALLDEEKRETYFSSIMKHTVHLIDFHDTALIDMILSAAEQDPEITDVTMLDKDFVLKALKNAIKSLENEANRIQELPTNELMRELIRRDGVIYERVGAKDRRTYTTDKPAYFILVPY